MDVVFKLRIFICLLLLIGFISSDCWAQSKLVKMPSVKACEHIVSYANKGELEKILIKSKKVDSDKISIPHNLSGVDSIFEIDINNDGVLERIFVESQGTAHFENFSVYKPKTDEAIELKELWDADWSDDKERWAADRAFVEYEGVHYVLGNTKS
jgi:hypothetical protein